MLFWMSPKRRQHLPRCVYPHHDVESILYMSETLPCDECYQAGICEFTGSPLYTSMLVEGTPSDAPSSPASCFYHCCEGGVLAAKQAMRHARQSGESGWIPFQTEHKPHIEDFGRFAALNVDGFENGTTVIFETGEPMVLTNVLTNPPRRRASQLR